MKNFTLFLSIMLFQFFGSMIGGIWCFIFVPFPLFVINKIIPDKCGRKRVSYFLFPSAFLLLDLTIYLPPRLARGMSFDVYRQEFWETLMLAFLVGGIEWGILRAMLFAEALFLKNKKE